MMRPRKTIVKTTRMRATHVGGEPIFDLTESATTAGTTLPSPPKKPKSARQLFPVSPLRLPSNTDPQPLHRNSLHLKIPSSATPASEHYEKVTLPQLQVIVDHLRQIHDEVDSLRSHLFKLECSLERELSHIRELLHFEL